jgi:hypothetical protein
MHSREVSMNCPACGAALEPNANFCGTCGRTVSATQPAPRTYGAVEDRPTRGVLFGSIVGVLLLVIGIGAFELYRSSVQRRLDALDYDTLNAEHDALLAAAEPLRRLAAGAVPETPPVEYARLTAEAKGAADRYREESRRGTPLPSKRPWPEQFEQAARALDESLEKYTMVGIYLNERKKIKNPTPRTTVAVDQNVANIAQMGAGALGQLDALLDAMRAQRENRAWTDQ